ncbi:MAG: DUF5678 domain-containing protein [archaeon]
MVSLGDEWNLVKNYPGQWVAIAGNKLLAHGTNAKKVYNLALKRHSSPRIFQVPDAEDELYIL